MDLFVFRRKSVSVDACGLAQQCGVFGSCTLSRGKVTELVSFWIDFLLETADRPHDGVRQWVCIPTWVGRNSTCQVRTLSKGLNRSEPENV